MVSFSQSRIQTGEKETIIFLDWVKKVPAKALTDTLFFCLNLPTGVRVQVSGAEKKEPRNNNEARFIKTGLPRQEKIIFEYSQPF